MSTATEPTVYFAGEDGEQLTLALSELPSLAGRRFAGEWWSVARERSEHFEVGTYLDAMRNPWPDGSFPPRLLEGFHLLGLLDYMLNALFFVRGPNAYGLNYGLDRVRFISPISLDDEIRLTGVVAEVREKGLGFLVRQDCTVEVRGREQPGFVAQWWIYWLTEEPFGTE